MIILRITHNYKNYKVAKVIVFRFINLMIN